MWFTGAYIKSRRWKILMWFTGAYIKNRRWKILMWFTGAYIKNRRWKLLMWFTGAYIKNTKYFVKLIFKIFTLEISKKKVPNILPRPVKHNLCLLFRSAHLAKTFFSVRDKLPATSALSKKKITAKKMKRFNLIQPPSGKSYDRHFEIIIECCRTIRLSDYQTVGLSAVGLSGCRTIRLSDYQAVGL